MKNNVRRMLGCLLVAALISSLFAPTANAKKAVTCKLLCKAAMKATGGTEKLKYMSSSAIDFGGLSASARKKVKSIQYVCDAKEVYSLCVIETANAKHAKSVLSALKKYKKNNCQSDYLSDYSSSERKVFKNAVCGRKGCYVWYIAMSPKKAKNNKGHSAIKKRL